MKLCLTFLAIGMTSLCGCTTLRVKQVDTSPERKITADFRASAWFSSAQVIAKFRAFMSDKSVSFGGSGIDQHGHTNTVAELEAIARILGR